MFENDKIENSMKLHNRKEVWNRLQATKYKIESISAFAQNEIEYTEEQLDNVMFEFDELIEELNSLAKSIKKNSR